MFCLSETIQNNPQIIAASDGSVSSSVRAYSWICSLLHGQRLATNHGPVFGSLPSSSHAEAYGLLSYLRCLYRISQYTPSPLPKETILYTDSASLIAKIGKIEKWPYFFPKDTMDPDWDVLQQIITSRCLFPSLPILHFVKGHQDADCPYVTLSLPAQLNVDTDHLAGSYAPCPNKNPTIIPMIAGTAVSLYLSTRTPTTKYRSALCKAASTDTIQHYIQNKNKCADAGFASINWVTHSHSVCRFYHKKSLSSNLSTTGSPLDDSLANTRNITCQHALHFPTTSRMVTTSSIAMSVHKGNQTCSTHSAIISTKPLQGHFLATCLSPVFQSGSTMNQPSSLTFPPYTTASFSTRHESAGRNCLLADSSSNGVISTKIT